MDSKTKTAPKMSKTAAAQRLDPRGLTPPHGATDREKLRRLVGAMEVTGNWSGRPLLRVNGVLWTGSHRLAAAIAAGLEAIPVLSVQIDQDDIDDFGPVTDDDDRLALLERVFGLDDNDAALLMCEEIANSIMTVGGAK